MGLVEGEALSTRVARSGPLDPREAGEIAAQFLAGLEAIHQAGLVHRDLKPENVMITRSGRVVVMDFGLAARAEERAADTVAGTLPYMAPELLGPFEAGGGRLDPPAALRPERSEAESKAAVDARVDLFAAGVVLAEMVSGDGPLEAERRRVSTPGAPRSRRRRPRATRRA
jgi:serine/threonine protein kinase